MADESRNDGARSARRWTFLTNHAHVLLCVAHDPDLRLRDISEAVGITERAAQLILADLITDGYVIRTKVGRRNHYAVNHAAPMRHPLYKDREIRPLIELLSEPIARAFAPR